MRTRDAEFPMRPSSKNLDRHLKMFKFRQIFMPRSFDFNIDCGESFGNWCMGADENLMPHVTTANLACGFHAGDPIGHIRLQVLGQSGEDPRGLSGIELRED